MADIQIINLCLAFRIERSISIGAPLVVGTLEGGASLGCFPVVAHRKVTGPSAIVSRVNRKNGKYDRALLTTAASPDTDNRLNPSHTPLAAAVAAKFLTGALESPYPVPDPPLVYDLRHRIGGLLIDFSSSTPNADPGEPLANGPSRHFATNGHLYLVGFGDGSFVDSAPSPGAIALANYRTFRVYTQATFCPGGIPEALVFLPTGEAFVNSAPGYYWPPIDDQPSAGTPAWAGAQGAAAFEAHAWRVSPGLDTTSGPTRTGDIATFALNGTDPVMVQRGTAFILQEEATMPAFGGSFVRDYNAAEGARPTFVIYANAGVDDVTLNGQTGQGYAVPALPSSRSSSTVGSFLTVPEAYTKAFAFSGFETENTFTLSVTAFGETMTTAPKLFAAGALNVWEGICSARTV